LTIIEPGTTSIRIPSATVRPSSTAAAARRSSIRPLVQEPTKTVSTAMSRIGVPPSRPMYVRARSSVERCCASATLDGSGMLESSGTPCAGLVPQVTNGASDAASSRTSRSKDASSSVTSCDHACTAASQSAPFGACGRPLR